MVTKEQIVRPKKSSKIGRDADFFLPSSDLCAVWKCNLFLSLFEWVENRGLEKGSYYFKWFLNRNRKPWFNKFDLKRKSMVSINRLRSGHTSLADSLFRNNIVDSPLCDCDEIQITYFGNVRKQRKRCRFMTDS